MSLEEFLTAKADELAPLDSEYPDRREYSDRTNPAAIDGDRWLEEGSTYIWRVGVLAQWDSNKCDYVRVFIGHERSPGCLEFIGNLYWDSGENDDIAASLKRYIEALQDIHPVFMDD